MLSSWGLGVPLYDGLDSAFFVPHVHASFGVVGDRHYAFTFDRYPEPTISVGSIDPRADIGFEQGGVYWNLYIPRVASWLAHRSKVHAYLGHLLDRRTLPDQIHGRTIVRAEHRFNPHMTYKIRLYKISTPWRQTSHGPTLRCMPMRR